MPKRNTNSKEFAKEKTPEYTYDAQVIPYIVQSWLAKMVVQYHVKHVHVEEGMAGTILTLIAESPESFPDMSGTESSGAEDFPEMKE